jgi:parvulin-like peptidyl-prolyl isomerase
MRPLAALLFLVLVIGCQKKDKDKPPTGSGSAGSGSAQVATPPKDDAKDIDSKDILGRTDVTAGDVTVKHVLLAWKDLAPTYGGRIDPRAKDRSNADAAKLAQEVAAELRKNPAAIDDLVKKHSEDPGSLRGEPYTVNKDTPFVPEFKNLALRLKDSEVGIVKTQFGYHVMERVPPPPPDPLESADILGRPAGTGSVQVRHVLVSWKDAPGARDPRAKARTKEDADKLAKEILAKVKANGDMAKLMKEYSEDPGSKDNAKAYDVAPDTPFVEPFKKLALRLNMNEAGLVKTPFGWHIIKRVPPPPPDPLESAEILKREPVTQKAKVKHILLGWTEVHAEDPRGTKRTRAELDKLVRDTMAKLQKGAKIETLMSELSEDPGSAKTGIFYEATPDASLVPPFKGLALRLKVGETGVVRTDFGIHIIQRIADDAVQPPPPPPPAGSGSASKAPPPPPPPPARGSGSAPPSPH